MATFEIMLDFYFISRTVHILWINEIKHFHQHKFYVIGYISKECPPSRKVVD